MQKLRVMVLHLLSMAGWRAESLLLRGPHQALGRRSVETTTNARLRMEVSSEALESFRSNLKGRYILAPLTRGGNLPFRRLCVDFGCEITLSEMAYARYLTQKRPAAKEKALLVHHPSELCYGMQIATNNIAEGLAAATMAQEAGASFLDLNCGCPIYEATRRGLGSALLRKPSKLGRLVQGIVSGCDIPVTVKIRSGLKEGEDNAREVVKVLQEAGAAVVTIHPRSQQQRYSRAANWDLLSEIAADPETTVPIIGNGDVLTYWEGSRRMSTPGVSGVMLGRGALIAPWIFKDCIEGKAWLPTSEERVEVYYRLATYMKEHFGSDAKGKQKAFYFLPFHFDFLCRWRPLKASLFEAHPYPMLQDSRHIDSVLREDEGPLESLPPLERLLRFLGEDAHKAISETLWESNTLDEAVSNMHKLATEELPNWEQKDKENRETARDRQTDGHTDGRTAIKSEGWG